MGDCLHKDLKLLCNWRLEWASLSDELQLLFYNSLLGGIPQFSYACDPFRLSSYSKYK